MSPFMIQPLLEATWQTIYMVFLSSFFGLLVGLAVGIALFLTRPGELWACALANRILGIVVNITRSVPFIIFMIAIIPLTRLLVGTTIGINAAVVPLTLAAIPFYARIAEAALSEVAAGLVEAAQAMGATTWQIVRKVYVPEALPALINGATLTIISLVSYSAMAGAVGGGGLGELAIQYGYQRFDLLVMLETVIILVVMVQCIQSAGDYLARHRRLKWLGIFSIVLWIACIAFMVIQLLPERMQVLKIGIVGAQMQRFMAVAKRVAANQYGVDLKVITFEDYVLPNTALNNGNIDANIFQHVPYLDAQIKARGYQLSPIAKTFIYPMGLYSHKIHSLTQVPYGAKVAIPNDPSNEGRALLLCQKAGLIRLKPGVGLFPVPRDITQNVHGLKFKAINAAEIPRVLDDVSFAAITNDYTKAAGFTVNQALYHEGSDSPYANVIVVQTQDKDKPVFKKLIAAMHSKPVLRITEQLFPYGAAIPAWKGAPTLKQLRQYWSS